jgi:hypothetical protein
LAAAGLPVLLLVVPWFILFYLQYGILLPEWVRPDAAMIESSGVISRAVSRPWHYYITESSMVAPVVLVVLLGYLARRRHLWSLRLGMPVVWVMTVVGVLTVLGLRGQGMKLRFLTIAAPGLYAALAAVLGRCDPRRSAIAIVALLAILYGAIYAGYFLLNPVPDEIQPVPQFIWQRLWAFR